MDKVKKCMDLHALIAIASGNEKFAKYLNQDFIITDITLAEFCSILLKKFGEENSQYWHDKLEKYSVNVDKRILVNAVKFKHLLGKKNVSFSDAVNYSYCIHNECVFVT